MSVPDFQSFFKPLLDIAADGQVHSVREARENNKLHLPLSEEDLVKLVPSGTLTSFDNRVTWANSHLVSARVLVNPRRGCSNITDLCRELLHLLLMIREKWCQAS